MRERESRREAIGVARARDVSRSQGEGGSAREGRREIFETAPIIYGNNKYIIISFLSSILSEESPVSTFHAIILFFISHFFILASLAIYLSIYLSMCLSIYLSIYPFMRSEERRVGKECRP